jgi:hypothetical protein
MKLTKTKEDMDITISAYYNFIGHRLFFTNTKVDELLKLGLDINHCKPLH